MIRSLLFLALAAASAHAADIKFGVVDMSKAFSEFHKTKDAADKFKLNIDKAQKEMNDRWAVYKNLMNDMQKLKKEASDPIMTPDARAKRAAEFDEKAKELRALEQEIGEAQNRRSGQLKQEDMQIGVPKQVAGEDEDPVRTGNVSFFNETKGFGFIKDSQTGESVFVHVNQLLEPIKEGNRVNFEVEMGAKGPTAIKVKKAV